MRDRKPRPDVHRSVDWDGIKQRLAQSQRSLERDFAPTERERRDILHARAQAMAVETPRPSAPADGIDVVEFVLAQEHYAIEAAFVREVQPLKELTGVPCTPAFVSGIIIAHGRILAVIDLKTFFELPESGLNDLNKVIILQHGELEFGILADHIVGVDRLALADIQPPLAGISGGRAGYLRGVTQQRLVVLDAKKLMIDPALIVDDEAGA
ncbi:chemotaxis protein CheW [Piscinibacter sp.]|uniref:chemotaxis protein CheW n=1 Tax=Piscinibacter sp. TaxID=1903157 RepID=UPI002C62A812|nr:chemotaxis protein CheW [Albitalea sp.]HUG24026.1 chemotaxis protein CheW [Albitalea sp.]